MARLELRDIANTIIPAGFNLASSIVDNQATKRRGEIDRMKAQRLQLAQQQEAKAKAQAAAAKAAQEREARLSREVFDLLGDGNVEAARLANSQLSQPLDLQPAVASQMAKQKAAQEAEQAKAAETVNKRRVDVLQGQQRAVSDLMATGLMKKEEGQQALQRINAELSQLGGADIADLANPAKQNLDLMGVVGSIVNDAYKSLSSPGLQLIQSGKAGVANAAPSTNQERLVDDLYARAKEAVKAGNKEEARMLLQQIKQVGFLSPRPEQSPATQEQLDAARRASPWRARQQRDPQIDLTIPGFPE